MSAALSQNRLMEEKTMWRKAKRKDKDGKLFGFWARPMKKTGDTPQANIADLHNWDCGIPGKAGTIWEKGYFKLHISFPEDYPAKPPKCKFVPPLFHPNVYPSGTVCLSILNEEPGPDSWRSGLTIVNILQGIQELLDDPNPESPAQADAYNLFKKDKAAYEKRVREEVRKNLTPGGG